ncbi:WD40/YVTN/BNR-like repeat-containing protein [Pelagicoccus mobilis]|uniref:Sortilin N-terminal domain-containing protein n=1 Tax=Pelagicoccus mobilis TaxID=415221 RepID=A0A934RVB9_9BACT|nr:hypothetical protein [Pelagicoccus mobilis]MBK1875491.1 hypothetical protein [Pelagicoccus mobilis]
MMVKTLAWISFLLISVSVFANGDLKWENLNPGAGGQIQDIVLDPENRDRLIYCSDVDGAYISEDAGTTWEYVTPETFSSNVLTAAFEPGNASRVYLGMHTGIATSDDSGRTWKNAFGSDVMHDPIMAIVVDPSDTNIVYAAPSNRNRWTDKEGRQGERGIWISRDRGESWVYTVYNKKKGARDVYSISIVPGRPGYVLLGGFDGMYLSSDYGKRWEKVRSPIGKNAVCWGTEVSPDGEWVYACFEKKAKESRLYAAPLESLQKKASWTDLFAIGKEPKSGTYWIPRIDPRSTDKKHSLLTSAPDNAPFGLLEFSVSLEGQSIPDVEWRQIMSWDSGKYGRDLDHSNQYTKDVGWEQYYTRPLSWRYTPVEWGEEQRGIWTTKDQTLFYSDTLDDAYPYNWDQRYCDFVSEIDGVRTYRTRGANCTVIFDSAVYKNYAIMCNADNGVTESWDDGYSWSVALRPLGNLGSRSNAATIIEVGDDVYALAHVATGWGAASYNGRIFAKKLDTLSPKDNWKQIAGGKKEQAGLIDHKFCSIVSDPNKPERIYVVAATKIHSYSPWKATPGAVYVCEDIVALIEHGKGGFVRMGTGDGPEPTIPEDQNRGLYVDPNDENTIYLGSEKLVWKATRDPIKGTWKWLPIMKGRWIVAWDVDGETSLAVSKDDAIYWSPDAGKNWYGVFRKKDGENLRQPAWYQDQDLVVNAMVESEGDLYFTLNTKAGHEHRGLGIFKLSFVAGKAASLSDVTGDLPLQRLMNAETVEKEGLRYLYVSTWGNGLWRLKL